MIFGRNSEPKDPIVGVDVGSETTYLGGLSPDGTDSLTIQSVDGSGPLFPTRAVLAGEESAVGHHSDELFDDGLPNVDVMGPFEYGRDFWAEKVVPFEEDASEPLRRRFFDYLYDIVDESVEDWNDRIAVPARLARADAGQDLLEEYLSDAGFDVEGRVSSPLASAIGYWEYDRLVDPHFELDPWDGGIVLSVDMGARYLDASVLSIQGHTTYRSLSTAQREMRESQTELYAEYKAEKRGLDISRSEETAPQRFGLLNAVQRHYPDLVTNERQMVTLTVPSEFGAEEGTQVTISASEAQQLVREQLAAYEDVVLSAIDDAGLDSLDDVDLVVTGGMPSRWPPVLEWWVEQGAAWASMANRGATIDPDSTVRITGGIGGKLLAAKGASAVANAEVGHWKHDIELSS